jgi:hypothetical protein
MGAFARGRQAIDGQAQKRQDLVVDDVVQKYGIRIKCVPVQDDAFFK